ncbi:hypothetical protein [Yinghuangia seranimata]|uniref:hypothetical protein n=1 Tax=Yinghuangia seranimata TaxID=408067 RepID=UPI00248ABF5A|nr:hypothetical protein [Yinghuangia seranimata]MDI2127456.1 hypothetical protein [Yinghuangia seranimata]
MRTTSRRLLASAALPTLVVVAACAAGGGKGGGTVPVAASAPAPASAPSVVGAPGQAAEAGASLAPEALPGVRLVQADLPPGWSIGEKATDDDTGRTERPECQPFADLMTGSGAGVAPTGYGAVGLVADGKEDALFSISMRTYRPGDAPALFDAARAALAACPDFRARDAQGVTTGYAVAMQDAPDLGDQALRGTIAVSLRGNTFTLPSTFVRSGNVVVQFSAFDPGGPEPAAVPDAIVRAQLAKLAAAERG